MDGQDQTSDLIQRCLHEECSESELAALEDLLIHNPRAADVLADALRLDAGLTRIFRAEGRTAEGLAKLTAPQPLMGQTHSKAAQRKRRLAWKIAIAASLLVIAIPLVRLFTGRLAAPLGNNELIQVVSGDVLVDGERAHGLRDGATIQVVGDRPAVLRLPEGLETEIAPGSSARLRSPAGLWQSVELNQGSATFRAERTQGEFRVETQLGCVTALGAEFSVQLKPTNPSGGVTMRNLAAMVVVVLTGVVQADVDGQSYVLGGGESRVFAQESRREGLRGAVRGHIVSVDTSKIILGGRRGAGEYELAADTRVTIDGHSGKIEDLAQDMMVALERNDGHGPVTGIKAEGPTLGGEVKSIDTGMKAITIVGPRGEQVLPFADDVAVCVDGRTLSLVDIQPGAAVALRLTTDKTTVVAITRSRGRGEVLRTLSGQVASVDPEAGAIGINVIITRRDNPHSTSNIRVSPNVKVFIDGREAKLSDVKVGDSAVVHSNEDQQIATEITVQRSKPASRRW